MPVKVMVGYDGSPEANAAIDAGALLFPEAHAWVTYLWVPPFASDTVRRRLRSVARDVNDLIDMVEREGESEAHRLVATGVTLASAAGWSAEPLLRRTWGGEGWRIAQAAEEVDADVVLVGSRGLGGTRAALGSVSDLVVHYCARPMVVVPNSLLAAEYAALRKGPVVVGWDGSAGADRAFTAAMRLFPGRDLVLVSVQDGGETSAADPSEVGDRHVTRLNVEPGHGFHAHSVADALVSAARSRDAATIVVGSRGRSAVRKLLLGSTAMATLHHSHQPVTVVPTAWETPAAENSSTRAAEGDPAMTGTPQ